MQKEMQTAMIHDLCFAFQMGDVSMSELRQTLDQERIMIEDFRRIAKSQGWWVSSMPGCSHFMPEEENCFDCMAEQVRCSQD